MTIEIRPATAEEMSDLGRLGGYVYGGSFGDEPDSVIATANRPEWTLCAFDGNVMASTFTNIPFTMRAQGKAMPLAGVSTIGTLPEYRRQGLARRIHTLAFEQMREAGQGVAALWASQAAIYQRYGYALSTVLRHYRVDIPDIQFFDGDAGDHDVRRVLAKDAYDEIKQVYIAHIAERMCYLHRSKILWMQNALEEQESEGPVWVALSSDAAGNPSGYAIFTLRSGRVEHRARSQGIVIRDFAWLDQNAYRSLWSFIAKHDLVGRVTWNSAPADDPAPELFMEPRLLHAEDHEGAWFRIIDIAGALGGRGYDTESTLDITITNDDMAPWNNGHWRLKAGLDEAQVKSRRSNKDGIALSIKALASLFTGFRSARELAPWGFLEGSLNAISRADQIFRTRHAPHCPDHF